MIDSAPLIQKMQNQFIFSLYYFSLYSCLSIFQPFSANTAPFFNFSFAVSMVTVFFTRHQREEIICIE